MIGMMQFVVRVLAAIAALAALAIVNAQTSLAANSPSPGGDGETVLIQTLTISDEHFLKGESFGLPTMISGTLRVAQGTGRRPLVILLHGSGRIEENAAVWEKVFL